MGHRSALLNVMVNAALKASKGLIRDFGEVEHLQVSKKGPADFVSKADMKAEDVLFEELSYARPKYGFLMEGRGEIKGESDTRWIIDPLDGTTNFLHGLPHFAISIAVEERGKLTAGVIYDPIKDEMFWAEKGDGAFMNDRRLRVSGRGDMGSSLLATGIPWKGRPGKEKFLAEAGGLMDQVSGIRRFGSAALDLAYVAAGRYDAFWEYDLNLWNVAAGIVLIREAGGMVTETDGRGFTPNAKSILGSNEELHTPMQRALKDIAKSTK